DQLRKEKPDDAELLDLAVKVATNRGDLSNYQGNIQQQLVFFQQAAQFQYESYRIKPSNRSLARAYQATTHLCSALADNGRYDEALKVLHDHESDIDRLLQAE